MKQVAWTITPGAGLELSSPAVWRPCSTSGKQPGSVTASSRAVDAHDARALDHGPHGARLVRARVGARLVLGLGGDQRVRRVLGAHRRERVALDAQQRLDLALGLLVGALAVVHRVQRRLGSHR